MTIRDVLDKLYEVAWRNGTRFIANQSEVRGNKEIHTSKAEKEIREIEQRKKEDNIGQLKSKDGACYYCGKKTNSLSMNPGDWAIFLCHEDEPGKVKPHHESCVMKRLREYDKQSQKG